MKEKIMIKAFEIELKDALRKLENVAEPTFTINNMEDMIKIEVKISKIKPHKLDSIPRIVELTKDKLVLFVPEELKQK